MGDEDVAFAGLAGQIELVRSGAVSARELVEMSLGRIERIDPELNSFAAVYGERALEQDRRFFRIDPTACRHALIQGVAFVRRLQHYRHDVSPLCLDRSAERNGA